MDHAPSVEVRRQLYYQHLLPMPNALVAISKDVWAVCVSV